MTGSSGTDGQGPSADRLSQAARAETVSAYRNVTGRPPGRLISLGAHFSRGVAQVRAEIAPYATAWHDANRRALREPGPRWVVLGDSMSVGVGASGPFYGYVGRAQRELRSSEMPVQVVNLAAYGARTEDVLSQQLPVWRALPPPDRGEVLSLFIGANDMLRRRWRRLLAATFAEVVSQLPDGSVVAPLPQSRNEGAKANRALSAGRPGRFIVVNFRGPTDEPAERHLAGDHFHPDDVGYQRIAAAFMPALSQAFAPLFR